MKSYNAVHMEKVNTGEQIPFWEKRQLHEKCKRQHVTLEVNIFIRPFTTQPRSDEFIYRDEYLLLTVKDRRKFMTE